MTFLEDMAELIHANDSSWELDQNMFIGSKPTDPDSALILTEYAGTGTARFTTTSVRSVQILLRERSNILAEQALWKIYKLMVPASTLVQLPSMKIVIINPRNTPFKISTDANGRHEWVLNLGVTYNYD